MPDNLPSAEPDFGRLLIQHQPQIYGYIRTLVFHRADAEDILQNTASVLWQKFDEFRPGTSFLAWALQVARYQVMYFQQKKRRDVLRFSESFTEMIAGETLAESARLANLHDALSACMDKLTVEDRDLFDRRYHADNTATTVARQLGKPVTTVYNALARIRRTLTECLIRTFRKEGFA